MESVEKTAAIVHFNQKGYYHLNTFIAQKKPSTIFIIVDENTHEFCYPVFATELETSATIEIIEIDAGEEFKNIETCSGIWGALIELNCDRNSLIINLGGGVITDIGGFIASTIKRGVDFIHVPTTVLGMVDAAIGGKNGVDLGHLKNQIGVINSPVMTLVDSRFLATLDQRQIRNGAVEMFKHGLINSKDYWRAMLNHSLEIIDQGFENLIRESIVVKTEIVVKDPKEQNDRKALNFGHTIGHAIESFCLDSDHRESLLHGEAIAAGLYAETYLSLKKLGLDHDEFLEIENWYKAFNFSFSFNEQEIDALIEIMSHDKKNVDGEIRFVLLNKIGSFQINQTIEKKHLIAILKLL